MRGHQSTRLELAEHLVFAGDDLEAAQAVCNEVFCRHSVRRLRRDEQVDVRQYAARVGDITVSRISYGAAVEIVAAEHPDRFFCIQLPDEGRAEISSGDERLVSCHDHASVPTPSDELRMRWQSGTTQIVVKIPEETVRSHLTRLLGHPPEAPIRPQLDLDLGSAAGARWLAIYELLLAEVSHGQRGEPALSASAAAVQDLVLTSFLLAHPNNYWEELARPPRGWVRPNVRRAMDFANANLDGPLTVAELARIAGVSVRTLQVGFRESVGCSPTAWIRSRRLEEAHAELAAAESGDGTSVTAVAMRWGFSHFGRFSIGYRQKFGASPSETLRG